MARLTVVGQSGTGKSYAAGALIERVLDPNHPQNPGATFDIAVHFDLEDEERGLSDAEHDPLLQRLDVDRNLAAKLDWVKVLYNHRRLRIFPDMALDDAQELLGCIARAMMVLCKDAAPDLSGFLSIDEGHNLIPQTNTDQRIHRLISGGRKHGVEFLVITQRPASLHTSAIELADRRFYFRLDGENDLRKVRDVATFNVGKLERLKDRQVIVENRSTGEHVVESTNDWARLRPHHADDDGIIDDALPV